MKNKPVRTEEGGKRPKDGKKDGHCSEWYENLPAEEGGTKLAENDPERGQKGMGMARIAKQSQGTRTGRRTVDAEG